MYRWEHEILFAHFLKAEPVQKIENNNFLSTYTCIKHYNKLGYNCSFGPDIYTRKAFKEVAYYGTPELRRISMHNAGF